MLCFITIENVSSEVVAKPVLGLEVTPARGTVLNGPSVKEVENHALSVRPYSSFSNKH